MPACSSYAKDEGEDATTCRDIAAAGRLVYRTHLYFLPHCPSTNTTHQPITLGEAQQQLLLTRIFEPPIIPRIVFCCCFCYLFEGFLSIVNSSSAVLVLPNSISQKDKIFFDQNIL